MSDLPEPKRRRLSEAEKAQRRWELNVAFLVLIAAYAALHKFIVPLGLKFTTLSNSPYSEIDLWFLHPILLLVFLRRDRGLRPFSALLCGAGIVYGVYEWVLIARGEYVGWLAVSRFVASTPFAILCIGVMTQKESRQFFSWAWAGAAILLVSLIPYKFSKVYRVSHDPHKAPKVVESTNSNYPIANSESCGTLRQKVNAEALTHFANLRAEVVSLYDCGLQPAIAVKRGDEFSLQNTLDRPVNFHFVYFDGIRKRQAWNIVVEAKQKRTVPNQLPDGSIGVLYSDSEPKAGLMVWSHSQLVGEWNIGRRPLYFEKVP